MLSYSQISTHKKTLLGIYVRIMQVADGSNAKN